MAAAGGALLPLAIEQRATHHTDWIARIALEVRLRQLLAQFLAGFGASTPSVVLAAAGLAAGVLMLRWAGRRQRHAAGLAGAIGIGGVVLALLLTAVGFDELLTRNLIAVLPPLIAAVSIGLAQPRTTAIGLAAAVIACAGWTAVDLRVLRDPGLERPDWRSVLRVLGPARVTRLLVLEHYRPQLPLRLYDPAIRRVRGGQVVRAREVDVIAPRVPRGRSCWWGAACNLSNARLPPAPTARPPAGPAHRGARLPHRAVRSRAPGLVEGRPAPPRAPPRRSGRGSRGAPVRERPASVQEAFSPEHPGLGPWPTGPKPFSLAPPRSPSRSPPRRAGPRARSAYPRRPALGNRASSCS